MEIILLFGLLSLVVTLILYSWGKHSSKNSGKSWSKSISDFNIKVLAGDPLVWLAVLVIFFLTAREIFFGK